MKITELGTRNVVFTFELDDWDLNLHLIKGDLYNYIIDTGLGSNSVKPILEYVNDDHKPIVVINSHFHWDHIWGNHCFKDSVIISSKKCRDIIIDRWDEMMGRCGNYVDGEVEKKLPTLVFEDELYFPDDDILLFYTPGHTIDGISVYDRKDKVLNAGDNIGDTMEELRPSQETSDEVFLETINKYKTLDVASCVSGHNQILGSEVFSEIERLIKQEG